MIQGFTASSCRTSCSGAILKEKKKRKKKEVKKEENALG